MEREVGGGIGMGNTCKPMADSFQCMTKPTTIKKKKRTEKKTKQIRPYKIVLESHSVLRWLICSMYVFVLP